MLARFSTLCAIGLALVAGLVSAQVPVGDHIPTNIEVTAQFPDNPFGMIVNGQRNKVLLDIANKEKNSYKVFAVTGSVHKSDDYSKVLRNLTSTRYGKALAAGNTLQVPYSFYSEYAPGDHALTVFIDLINGETVTRVVGYNGTITVIEPEGSWFDLQLLVLYGILFAGAAGIAYIVREVYFVDSKKKTKKAAKPDEPASRPAHRDENGEMILDQSWLPENHLNSPKKTSPKLKKRASRK